MVIFINSISYGWSYAQRSCHCQFWDQMCSFQKSIICRCFAIALMFPMHLRKARNLLCGKLEGGGLERGEHVSSWKLSLFLLMFYQILKQLESYRNTIFFWRARENIASVTVHHPRIFCISYKHTSVQNHNTTIKISKFPRSLLSPGCLYNVFDSERIQSRIRHYIKLSCFFGLQFGTAARSFLNFQASTRLKIPDQWFCIMTLHFSLSDNFPWLDSGFVSFPGIWNHRSDAVLFSSYPLMWC